MFVNDEVQDQGLDWAIANGNRLHLCTTDPGGTYATVTGNDVGDAAVALTKDDGAIDGRELNCPAATITPNASGTVTHWAITNNTDTVIASGAFSASFAATNGVDVDVPAFVAATKRDPA